MHLKNPQKLILSLLLDDLVHNKLLYGLSALDLEADKYTVDLGDKVIMLMGFRGKQNELVYEYYLNRREECKSVDLSGGNAAMKALANTIYKELLQYKRKV